MSTDVTDTGGGGGTADVTAIEKRPTDATKQHCEGGGDLDHDRGDCASLVLQGMVSKR